MSTEQKLDPVTFDNRGQPNKPLADQGFINGDGVLVYPGRELLHPEEDRGVAGPIARGEPTGAGAT